MTEQVTEQVTEQDTRMTRRRLLRHATLGTAGAAAVAIVPRPLRAVFGQGGPEPIPTIQDDRIKALVLRGLDAARTAGATYADIRMTHTRERSFGNAFVNPSTEAEYLHVGARALVDGYWGFASSPVWSPDELVRLAREAVRQAKANGLGTVREIHLPPAAPVRDGHWETPIEIDPLAFHPDEMGDYLLGTAKRLEVMVRELEGWRAGWKAQGITKYNVTQQSKAFGSTDGSYVTQRLTRSRGSASVEGVRLQGWTSFQLTGAGWELFRNSPVIDLVRENIEYNQHIARLPVKPLDVGRYATVLDAESVANLMSHTIGTATQLDRALGYEANAGGTSYLVDPDEMLGTFAVAPPTVTITANRSERGGIATTQWDDEGTPPSDFTIVDKGIVADFHTSREGAGWLKPRYEQLHRPFRSNGCLYCETGADMPTIHTANLTLQAASSAVSYADLEAGVDKGMSLVGLKPDMDFQMINGYSPRVECFELLKGKRVARIRGAGILFRTPELWKSIIGIGGAGSQQRFGLTTTKGQPSVTSYHSATAVPVVLKELTFIDSERR